MIPCPFCDFEADRSRPRCWLDMAEHLWENHGDELVGTGFYQRDQQGTPWVRCWCGEWFRLRCQTGAWPSHLHEHDGPAPHYLECKLLNTGRTT